MNKKFILKVFRDLAMCESASVTSSFRGKTWKLVSRLESADSKSGPGHGASRGARRRRRKRGVSEWEMVGGYGGGRQSPVCVQTRTRKRVRKRRNIATRERRRIWTSVLLTELIEGVQMTPEGYLTAIELHVNRWGYPTRRQRNRLDRQFRSLMDERRRAEAETESRVQREKEEKRNLRRDRRAQFNATATTSSATRATEAVKTRQEQAQVAAGSSGASLTKCWCGKGMPSTGCHFCMTRKQKLKSTCTCR